MAHQPKTPLKPQQILFCEQYCEDFNGEQAAIRAGYSELSARSMASDFIRDQRFKDKITEILRARRLEYGDTVERMKTEVMRIAFANPFDVIKSLSTSGILKLKDLRDIPNRLKPAVKTIKKTKDGVEITFHDKIGALEMLAKHFGFFEQDNKQKLPQGVAVYLPDNGRDKKTTITLEETEKKDS